MPDTYIIAEIGVNHNGCIDIAKKMIDAAKSCGADAVKFQTYKTENIVTKDAQQADYQIKNTGKSEAQFEMLKNLELSEDDHKILQSHCHDRDIEFLSSAFDIESADFLINDIKLETIKLGSGELTNAPLLHFIAMNKAKIILSTGMSTLDEIKEALGVLTLGYQGKTPKSRTDFKGAFDQSLLKGKVTLLHCTSDYPASMDSINLAAIDTLNAAFGLPVGYSDHSIGGHVTIAAVARGARVIEKHFTLNTSMEGPDHKASMMPQEFGNMVQSIRDIEIALGNGDKIVHPNEENTKKVARKSIVANADIKADEGFSINNITTKRPENGLSPFDYWDIIGTKAKRHYSQDDPIKHKD